MKGRWFLLRLSGFLALLAVLSCQSSQRVSTFPDPTDRDGIRSFSADQLKFGGQCKSMLDQYCNHLYSPEVLGNLAVGRDNRGQLILRGETRNGFSQIFYRYAKAKLTNRQAFPADLSKALNEMAYFSKLETFLSRPPRSAMSRGKRLVSERLENEIDFVWSAAIEETILERMIKKYPGFHRIPEKLMPDELFIERRKVRRQLISEISKAVWRNDKNWTRVEVEFQKLRESFLTMIGRLAIPADLKSEWSARIQEVKLVLPGSLTAISDEECSTVTSNAYYYTYLNVITVCAGDFNTEDIIQTLAHELAHAIDIDRGLYLFQVKSDFGRELGGLRGRLCTSEKFSCETWSKYKENFSTLVESLEDYEPELVDFQRCLKRRPTYKKLKNSDIERLAERIVANRVSELAESDRFLRITKARIPSLTGKLHRNPNYLNPCTYYLWTQGEEPIDDELTTLLFFTAEYRCLDLPPEERLRQAIETSKTMTKELLVQTLWQEGEFSSRNSLEAEGFSSSPAERFADVIGSYALAERLAQVAPIVDRRNRYLASSSWMCSRPSLATRFPLERSVESEFMLLAHSEGDKRKMELLSEPIRKVIACEKDFKFNECQLPFNH